jgi:Domain of unknown function (DUF5615)
LGARSRRAAALGEGYPPKASRDRRCADHDECADQEHRAERGMSGDQAEQWTAHVVGEVGLTGRSDEDVFAHAWRDKRMLWTHDRDFLDDARFPEHRNPGVVVLPGARGHRQAMDLGVGTALAVFGHAPDAWHKTKSVVTAGREMIIRRRRLDTGKIETTRYRMTNHGFAQVWLEPL